MTPKCGKNKEVTHEPQVSVSLMFLPHFDVICDLLLNKPAAKWNLFVLYNDQKRIRIRRIHIPASYRLTVRGFMLVQAFFESHTLLFVSSSSFFLILLVNSFFKKFFNVFTCSKQKCRKHFVKQRDSRSEHDTRWQLL